MFRQQPLTVLFIVATLVVDGVLIATSSDSPSPSPFKLGIVLGQLAATAIWAVRGRPQRLTRASCLVFMAWAQACLLHGTAKHSTFSIWFTFSAGYAFAIVTATLLADYFAPRFRRNSEETLRQKHWQISLMECFGWTIVVSIISFGARHMTLDFLFRADAAWTVIAFLAVPVVIVTLIRRDLRGLRARRAFGIVLVTFAAAWYLATIKSGGEYVTGFQAAYLILWLAVLGMDEVLTRAKNVRQSLQEEEDRASEPTLFNPQD